MDIDFALSVLCVFGGGAPILETAKFIVKVVPEKSPAWNELAAALETAGVVMGEYGMAEAFERKRRDMLIWSDDEDPRVRRLAYRRPRPVHRSRASARGRGHRVAQVPIWRRQGGDLAALRKALLERLHGGAKFDGNHACNGLSTTAETR